MKRAVTSAGPRYLISISTAWFCIIAAFIAGMATGFTALAVILTFTNH